ncbi:hypothetical protein NEOLEDRAFT_1238288 [Neolentinus lepideus HHB14362 ss-1]|uniref:P-loop containing nucleoside triphosphate hydrolase protein n=1 Tax=Neolentinus lepideus HHB14362 ss-1 TaxID=1314782 RepID=A0A165VTI6_9AGAM|nr:hypothetical protein NEOLEDRAFT_1238288 [Neolentinus lepideus HHB14362 ss-1]
MQKKARPSFRFLDGVDMKPPWIPDSPVAVSLVEETPMQPFSPKSKGGAKSEQPAAAVRPVKEEPSLEEHTESNRLGTSHTSTKPNGYPSKNQIAVVPDVITHQDEYRVLKELETVKGFAPGVKLLPHQNHARQWMAHREAGNRRGGIIADDMGTGKTVQALVRIVDGRATAQDKKDGWSGATLIVCPPGLKDQWIREVAKFAPGLRVLDHHEPKRTSDPKKLMNADIVITTYGVVRSVAESTLFGVRWLRIFLDEAHEIRNRQTQAAKACCKLEGKYRWCMTGTPIQNKVEDLYPLFCFIGARPLNDWDIFKEKVARPVSRGLIGSAMQKLHIYLNGVMIRRRKDTLINGHPIVVLPSRTVQLIVCPFTSSERKFYDVVEAWVVHNVWEMIESGEIQRQYVHVLVWLLRLRQACNHPRLFYGEYVEEDTESRALVEEIDPSSTTATVRQWQRPMMKSSTVKDPKVFVQKVFPSSAKIRAIIRLLGDIRTRSGGTEKTIVYSQWTRMLDLIEKFMDDKGIRHTRYDGLMTLKKRTDAINTFATDAGVSVALVSLKAGGIGLNLTMCNNVILTDPWWNPAAEEQAFDRVHRLGQKRPVHIYTLTTEDTIEGRILELQEKKRALAVAALSGERLKGQKLTLEELLALFGIHAR